MRVASRGCTALLIVGLGRVMHENPHASDCWLATRPGMLAPKIRLDEEYQAKIAANQPMVARGTLEFSDYSECLVGPPAPVLQGQCRGSPTLAILPNFATLVKRCGSGLRPP